MWQVSLTQKVASRTGRGCGRGCARRAARRTSPFARGRWSCGRGRSATCAGRHFKVQGTQQADGRSSLTRTHVLSAAACDAHKRCAQQLDWGLAARQVPGDGRERVATVASAVKARAVACGLLSHAACCARLSGARCAGTNAVALSRHKRNDPLPLCARARSNGLLAMQVLPSCCVLSIAVLPWDGV